MKFSALFPTVCTVLLISTSTAHADLTAYQSCMRDTLENHVLGNIIGPLFGGSVSHGPITARGKCAGKLTVDEAAQLYRDNDGWYKLHEPGGDLDVTRPNFSEKI